MISYKNQTSQLEQNDKNFLLFVNKKIGKKAKKVKKGDQYLHFKGHLYEFQCIALPKTDPNLTNEIKEQMRPIGDVRFHENTHDLTLFEYSGIYFIDSAIPHVIYRNVKNHKTWARPVDDFFGYKEIEKGKWKQRFTRVAKGEGE
jgi:hypothetical protein